MQTIPGRWMWSSGPQAPPPPTAVTLPPRASELFFFHFPAAARGGGVPAADLAAWAAVGVGGAAAGASARRAEAQRELTSYYATAGERKRESPSRADGEAGLTVIEAALGPSDACDDDCCICLESLSAAQAARLARCPHALHLSCLSSLIASGGVLCPICRASLVPAALEQFVGALGSPAARPPPVDPRRLAAGFIPGVEAREGGSLTLADWEWENDAELGLRLGPEAAAVFARHRLEMQRTTFGRQVCSRVSLFVTFSLCVPSG